MNTLEQINKVLSAKAEALIARSSVHLSEIIDDDFIYINSQGKKLNKAQYIEQCTVGALKFKSQRFENIEIQDFDSFAVATMILHDEFEYSDQFYA